MRSQLRDITQTMREYAEAIDKDRGFSTGVTDTLRDAATVIDEQDREIARLQEERDNWHAAYYAERRAG